MTALLLAAIEGTQGICIAAFQGLDILKRALTKKERKQEQQRRMSESVHRVMEMDG